MCFGILPNDSFLLQPAMDATSSFELEVKGLCERIIGSNTEYEAIQLTCQLQELLRERFQYPREKAFGIHLVKRN
jgi:hypothetical protein